MDINIITGDVMTALKSLPDESVDCCVTSPPYWGLRDYGIEGQLGLEKTLGEHIEAMVAVFKEVHRVLKKTGTCWVNYGDCYATAPNGRSAADTKANGNDDRTFRDKPFSTVGPIYPPSSQDPFRRDTKRRGGGLAPALGTLKPKDLCMMPNRLAIALQDDGWWVRSEIIWAKPNPMPESITDRPATSHEKIFMLTKSAKYFYDADAVRTELKPKTLTALGSMRADNGGGKDVKASNFARTMPERKPRQSFPTGWASGKGAHNSLEHNRPDKQRGHSRKHAGFNDRWDKMSREEQQANGANLRNIWTIATRGYDGAHFATFPIELPQTCIKAGCPIGGTVLDPFGGAGTTAIAANRHGRNSILIELNPKYVALAKKRILDDIPMFTKISESKC